MFSSLNSSCLVGMDAVAVNVEINLRAGQPRFSVLGLGGAAVKESRERIVAALEFCGFDPPDQILVNLAPAELKKEGSSFDLPIAVGILAAMGIIPYEALEKSVICGELSLTGGVKPLHGAISHALSAAGVGAERLFLPAANAREAAMVSSVRAVPIESLAHLVRLLLGKDQIEVALPPESLTYTANLLQLSDVVGQRMAKRALEVAAAGGHNMLMVGPPGCGKSMLASRLSGLLPELTHDETLEVTRVHSVAGQSTSRILQGERPFRSPHYIISDAGLVGGGSVPRPGEISLAHRGVLFLDELPEFRRSTIEALRSPIETGVVHLARAKGSVKYPSQFQLIAAMNPCPCGRLGVGKNSCRCSHSAVRDYLARLSQPILDRIDIQVELDGIALADLAVRSPVGLDRDEDIRKRVSAARELQIKRFGTLNCQVADIVIREQAGQTDEANSLLVMAAQKLGVSARGYMRLLRVSRTIADLAGDEKISAEATAEALSFRCLERLQNVLTTGRSVALR